MWTLVPCRGESVTLHGALGMGAGGVHDAAAESHEVLGNSSSANRRPASNTPTR
jgi:hypothetical protein